MSLKQIIKDQGRTQRWVAMNLEIPEDTMSRILADKQALPLEKIAPLAALLGLTIEDIVREAAPEGRG